jgi:3-oxoadipate enol-lactonase
MERVALDDLELAYDTRGAGEPVVLIHWGLCAAWAEPLLDEPSLSDHQLVSYHRAGFGESDRIEGPLDLGDHAAHCAALLRVLGIEQAHVVGHSSSADIALQLALDFPDIVRTLALLEPARPVPESSLQAEFVRDVVAPAVARYREGDRDGAVDVWARGVFGPNYREPLEAGLTGAVEQAVADSDAFFAQELPALRAWTFTADGAARIDQPTLGILGSNTAPSFPERLRLLASWLPNAELVELPGATHLLHVEEPRTVAEALAAFYADH